MGLPPASKNADTWPIKKALLGMPGLVASPELIQETKAFLHAMLRLRYSSPLFRLPPAAIMEQVRPQPPTTSALQEGKGLHGTTTAPSSRGRCCHFQLLPARGRL